MVSKKPQIVRYMCIMIRARVHIVATRGVLSPLDFDLIPQKNIHCYFRQYSLNYINLSFEKRKDETVVTPRSSEIQGLVF